MVEPNVASLIPHNYSELANLLKNPDNKIIGSGYIFHNSNKSFFNFPKRSVLLHEMKDLKKKNRSESYIELGSMINIYATLQFLRREGGRFHALIIHLERLVLFSEQSLICLYDLLLSPSFAPSCLALLKGYGVRMEYLELDISPEKEKKKKSRYKNYTFAWHGVRDFRENEEVASANQDKEHLRVALVKLRFPVRQWSHQIYETIFLDDQKCQLQLFVSLNEGTIEDIHLLVHIGTKSVYFSHWEELFLGQKLPVSMRSYRISAQRLREGINSHHNLMKIDDTIVQRINNYILDKLLQFFLQDSPVT